MIEAIRLVSLYAHIVAGFVALLAGPVAMLAAKGRALHRRAGMVYVWAMTAVVVTAVLLAVVRPNLFLLGIAVLSFFLTFTGYRALFLKRLHLGEGATLADRLVAFSTLAFGLGLIAHAAVVRGGDAVLALAFGGIAALLAFANLRRLGGEVKKGDWFFDHIVGMLSAYIATFTAFAVTNATFLPPLFVWLLPSAIGTIAITLTVAGYRSRMSKGRRLEDMAAIRIGTGKG